MEIYLKETRVFYQQQEEYVMFLDELKYFEKKWYLYREQTILLTTKIQIKLNLICRALCQ